MATLGTLTLAFREAERSNNVDVLRYDPDPNDVNWSDGVIVIPDDILEAHLIHAHAESRGATVNHVVDYTVQGEVAVMSIQQPNKDGIKLIVSEPIRGVGADTAAATPTRWYTYFRIPHEILVRGGDRLTIVLPPAEDNVAATGTYVITITLRVLRYSRQ